MKASTEFEMRYALYWGWLCFIWLWEGCSSAPPGSYGVNAFGVGVTYSTPGWSAPAKVVPTQSIQSPALLVPLDSALANNESATVTNGQITATVPIVAAPVAAPVLAVPK
jgi:hypothetical protein